MAFLDNFDKIKVLMISAGWCCYNEMTITPTSLKKINNKGYGDEKTEF
jgi:hypothetical protein